MLEEDLEFDTVGKQVPLVTEEKVKNLEEKIKQRILEVRPPSDRTASAPALAVCARR